MSRRDPIAEVPKPAAGAYRLARGGVVRVADGAFLPQAPDNGDWMDFLDWRDAGGVPLPLVPEVIADALDDLNVPQLVRLLRRKFPNQISQADIDLARRQ